MAVPLSETTRRRHHEERLRLNAVKDFPLPINYLKQLKEARVTKLFPILLSPFPTLLPVKYEQPVHTAEMLARQLRRLNTNQAIVVSCYEDEQTYLGEIRNITISAAEGNIIIDTKALPLQITSLMKPLMEDANIPKVMFDATKQVRGLGRDFNIFPVSVFDIKQLINTPLEPFVKSARFSKLCKVFLNEEHKRPKRDIFDAYDYQHLKQILGHGRLALRLWRAITDHLLVKQPDIAHETLQNIFDWTKKDLELPFVPVKPIIPTRPQSCTTNPDTKRNERKVRLIFKRLAQNLDKPPSTYYSDYWKWVEKSKSEDVIISLHRLIRTSNFELNFRVYL